MSLTTPLWRLDLISFLSTETAARNIVRVEARPQTGEDPVDSIDTIAEAPFTLLRPVRPLEIQRLMPSSEGCDDFVRIAERAL